MYKNQVDGKDIREEYLKTLTDKPWENCPCPICKELGMEVIVFRGNNRNRRRGFHNTYVFYQILQKILNDPGYKLPEFIQNSNLEKLLEQKSLTEFLEF